MQYKSLIPGFSLFFLLPLILFCQLSPPYTQGASVVGYSFIAAIPSSTPEISSMTISGVFYFDTSAFTKGKDGYSSIQAVPQVNCTLDFAFTPECTFKSNINLKKLFLYDFMAQIRDTCNSNGTIFDFYNFESEPNKCSADSIKMVILMIRFCFKEPYTPQIKDLNDIHPENIGIASYTENINSGETRGNIPLSLNIISLKRL